MFFVTVTVCLRFVIPAEVPTPKLNDHHQPGVVMNLSKPDGLA